LQIQTEGFRQEATKNIPPVVRQSSGPKFLTVEEVAELLRVSPRSVYDWVSQGAIPFRKAGRRTIFLLEEVLNWTGNESK
jgi:excisionase family DNA binding protein